MPESSPLEMHLGITRVARVTGLDRLGVEVACAVRPGGHVLQVCNGKGRSWEHAHASAVMECAELWAAERRPRLPLRWGTAEALAAEGALGISPGELPLAPLRARVEDWDVLEHAWAPGEELLTGQTAWVPAFAVYCSPADGPLLGLATASWSSNGSGAHSSPELAREHALYELLERDQLALALPQGWTPETVRQGMLSPAQLARACPWLAAEAERLDALSLDLHAFDFRQPLVPGARTGLGVPLAAVLLFDRERGAVPLAAGYACRASEADALGYAYLEAAQTRLTDIHGAREDVAPMRAEDVERMFELCQAQRQVLERSARRRSAPGRAMKPLQALRLAGHERVVALELGDPERGLSVQKVLGAGLRVSEVL